MRVGQATKSNALQVSERMMGEEAEVQMDEERINVKMRREKGGEHSKKYTRRSNGKGPR